MKIIVSLVLLLMTTTVSAESFFGGNVQLGWDSNDQANARVEYWWGAGKFSGYGYQDFYNLGSSTTRFADHRLRYHFSNRFFVVSETRLSSFGKSQKFGLGVQLAKTSLFDSVFNMLNVTYYGLESGSGDTKQTVTVWWTKPWQLTESLSVYSTGVSRIRQGAQDFHEPQIWFSVKEKPVEFGVELDIFDGVMTPQVNLKWSF